MYLSIYYVIILAALELSLSFDNAVVNARVLNKLAPIWQTLFLWVGLPSCFWDALSFSVSLSLFNYGFIF